MIRPDAVLAQKPNPTGRIQSRKKIRAAFIDVTPKSAGRFFLYGRRQTTNYAISRVQNAGGFDFFLVGVY